MTPIEAELIERAKALVPVLAERAQACEDGRRLPDETLQDFRMLVFTRLPNPRLMAATRCRRKSYSTSLLSLREVVLRVPGVCV